MKAIIVNDTKFSILEADYRSWLTGIGGCLLARKIITNEKLKLEVTLVFLNKIESKRLNWTYRQKDHPTDVLSFSSEDPACLGDLVICPEVLDEQAKKNKHDFEKEAKLMVLHGVLHLLGFDHDHADDKGKMLQIQDEIFLELTKPKAKIKTKPKLKAAAKNKSNKKNTKPLVKPTSVKTKASMNKMKTQRTRALDKTM